MLKLTALAAVAVLALAGCGGASGTAPLVQSTDCTQAGVTCEHTDPPAAIAPVATEAPPVTEAAPVAEAPAVSTCDVAREALLTGTPASITASMEALVADRTAPVIAREYARYYTVRDKGNVDQQSMDEGLITSACS